MNRLLARPLPPLTVMGWLRFDAIRRAVGEIRPLSVLELGCGQGAMATWFAARASYVGVEPDSTSRVVAQARVRRFVDAEIVDVVDGVTSRTFDLACAFEVLEHIDDDLAALTELCARVRPRGHVIVSVPAHPQRFGASDQLVGHHRRYSRGALIGLLEGAGLVVEAVKSYGAGGGHLLDRMQDAVAAKRIRAGACDGPVTVGTEASGRYRQPRSDGGAIVRAIGAAPLRVVQAPFTGTDIGVGYIARARTGMSADHS